MDLADSRIKNKDYEDALEVLLEAQARGAGVKVDHQISLVRKKILAKRWIERGRRLLDENKAPEAYSLFLNARSKLSDSEEILKLDRLIGRCKKALD